MFTSIYLELNTKIAELRENFQSLFKNRTAPLGKQIPIDINGTDRTRPVTAEMLSACKLRTVFYQDKKKKAKIILEVAISVVE